MPLSRLVLIVMIVLCAAGLTVFLVAFVTAGVQMPGFAALVAIPFLLGAYVVWRVIADRLGNADDDRYEKTPK